MSKCTKVTAVVSGGSKDNIEMMDMEEYQMGFVQTDVMSYAYDGTNLFEGAAIDNFSTVAALYMEQVQIITCDPSIKTVADLKGKNVSIGSSGSGVYFNALDVLVLRDRNCFDSEIGKLRLIAVRLNVEINRDLVNHGIACLLYTSRCV